MPYEVFSRAGWTAIVYRIPVDASVTANDAVMDVAADTSTENTTHAGADTATNTTAGTTIEATIHPTISTTAETPVGMTPAAGTSAGATKDITFGMTTFTIDEPTAKPPTATNTATPGKPVTYYACKSFNHDCIMTHFPVEREAYQRFTDAGAARPRSILAYHGLHPDFPAGILLDLAPLGNLRNWLLNRIRAGKPGPGPALLVKWAKQAAEGLGFAHGLGVCNSDVHPVNFFLDHGLDLYVGDWAGASIDGGVSHSSYRQSYRKFDAHGNDVSRVRGISPETEVFALGTAMYFMVTGHEPWPQFHEVDDKLEIKAKIVNGEFPDTKGLRALGGVIEGCWKGVFEGMNEVKQAIEAEMEELAAKAGGEGEGDEVGKGGQAVGSGLGEAHEDGGKDGRPE